jgi:hypothetical protein
MTDEEKLPYQQLSENDRQRFERELEEYFKDCKNKNIPIRYQRWLREARMKPLECFNLSESHGKDQISPCNSSNNSIFEESHHDALTITDDTFFS